jgi:hypothetical protein
MSQKIEKLLRYKLAGDGLVDSAHAVILGNKNADKAAKDATGHVQIVLVGIVQPRSALPCIWSQ